MSVGQSPATVDISAEQVKKLREMTGAGMMDCKRALAEAGGDLDRAQEILRKKGFADAAKRAGKVAAEGVVEAYIHMNGKLGVLVEVNCETDFVANTDEFHTLARDIAMQIAASDPWWIRREDVPQEVLERERKLYEEQAKEEKRPEAAIPKIVEGRIEKKLYRERVLLDQPFFRDPEGKQTTGDRLAEVTARVGEKVEVRRFARFVRGQDDSGG